MPRPDSPTLDRNKLERPHPDYDPVPAIRKSIKPTDYGDYQIRQDLSPMEQKFVNEYLKDGNATRAVIRAGLKTTAERDAARAMGLRLLKKPQVVCAIGEAHDAMYTQGVMTATEILQMYTRIAKGEELDQFGLDASLKDRLTALKELSRLIIEVPARANQGLEDQGLTIKLLRE